MAPIEESRKKFEISEMKLLAASGRGIRKYNKALTNI